MILDTLDRATLYHVLGAKFEKAFDYLRQTDFSKVEKGKYEIDGTHIFAIVNEYDTIEEAGEQMEAHRKYIDIQYVVNGEERIGHDFLGDKSPSKAYSETEDYMLFAEKPAFYTHLKAGQFAIFFPTDLHMPNLRIAVPVAVKKVVIKISVA
ncbi:MAG: YhcH/YjgK/YiaL family protein [Chitinophaga sp.]|uniref:YhcH/YjgK/YiaL family protein n=1 Tax=Chitinophaga sp. TaxID=1869181 RepID=UPI0025C5BDD4|nr:YhcH/YjgK/YiaL family protein [Chitinophaga sp.]MBV8251254.1 YhcH/YjgK/YiaL family protein [Chitinophaga sp.]